MKLFVRYIELTLICSIVSNYGTSGYSDINSRPVLYLLETKNPEHISMNYDFMENINRSNASITIKTLPVNNGSLSETISAVNNFTDVINLKVNLYNNKESTVQPNLTFQENRRVTTNKTNCVIDFTNTSQDTPCKIKEIQLHELAAFSKSIDNNIIDIVLNYLNITDDTPKKVPKRHTPSICVRSEAFDKSNLGPIISKCKANEIPDNVAVVLAPSPLDFYSPVPHIFYDINYLLPEFEENYPNSVTFLPWQPVVHALVRFLQEMEWKRIAVISDDSYFSEIFENELISRFNELEFVYAVKQCLYNMNDEYDQAKNNCFDKGLSELKYTNQEYKVRIIIANVEDYNIAKLMEAARSNGITAHWIFRCPVQNKHRKGFPFIDIFSIKLSAFDMNYDEEDYNLRARISHVNNTLRTVDWSNKTILYEHIKKSFPMQIDVRATIMRRDYRFGTIDISGNKVQNVRLNKPSFSDLPNCYVRSNNFDRPCDNFLIFLLFLVLIMFLLILLIISIYFNNIRTVNGQYLNIL